MLIVIGCSIVITAFLHPHCTYIAGQAANIYKNMHLLLPALAVQRWLTCRYPDCRDLPDIQWRGLP